MIPIAINQLTHIALLSFVVITTGSCGSSDATGNTAVGGLSGAITSDYQFFITTKMYTPGRDFSSLSEADSICQQEAKSMGLDFSQIAAVLADTNTSAYDHVASVLGGIDSSLSIRTTDGKLLSGPISSSASTDCPTPGPVPTAPFDCIQNWPSFPIAQSTFWFGATDLYSKGITDKTCTDWSSASTTGVGAVASTPSLSATIGSGWFHNDLVDGCSNNNVPIACVGNLGSTIVYYQTLSRTSGGAGTCGQGLWSLDVYAYKTENRQYNVATPQACITTVPGYVICDSGPWLNSKGNARWDGCRDIDSNGHATSYDHITFIQEQ